MRNAGPLRLGTLARLTAAAYSAPARADLMVAGDGTLGHFQATLAYVPAGATSATLTVTLSNTSPSANGGYLTGFVLNNPGGLITGASLLASNPNFRLLGGPDFSGGVNGAPYGQFDLGASTFKSFEGGGNPGRGIAAGDSASFTFALAGSHLDTLGAASFASALSGPPGEGMGPAFFVARFRGFLNGGSEKVAGRARGGDTPAPADVAPEPGSLALAAAGLLGLLGCSWRRRPGR